jgi:hypothetical protein
MTKDTVPPGLLLSTATRSRISRLDADYALLSNWTRDYQGEAPVDITGRETGGWVYPDRGTRDHVYAPKEVFTKCTDQERRQAVSDKGLVGKHYHHHVGWARIQYVVTQSDPNACLTRHTHR